MEKIKNKLIELYNESSKHSGYQILASNLEEIVDKSKLKISSRYERERLNYIISKIDLKGKRILDIGGNTGFFTFESSLRGAESIDFYEGNDIHAQFVELGVKYLGLEDIIHVYNQYYSFDIREKSYDVVFLMNVLHHIGDDYGNSAITLKEAKENIIFQLNGMAEKTKYMVFQMGFNWKGNRDKGLFENGTKEEMVEFIKEGTKECWKIVDVGVAERISDDINYVDLNDYNRQRMDEIGEFLNRPIFILKSIKQERKELDCFSGTYENRNSEFLSIMKKMNIDVMLPYIEPMCNGIALELGCGEGDSTKLIAPLFKQVVVREGSKKFIDKAKENLKEYKNIYFSEGLFETFIAKEQFDVIIANYIFEHIEDVQQIMNICYDSLKEKGILFITVPNAKALSRQLALKMELIDDLYSLTENDLKHGHKRVFDMQMVLNEVEKTSFRVKAKGGLFLKEFADFQLKQMLETGLINEKHFIGMRKLAEDYPDIAGSVWVCLEK